ncbi:5'-nucleotidase, lipoprotein e(P4) family [Pseudoxanthomonas broegbernensis]|uniref:5'-nucleotidase, lipoprotein e(P4) family n=1 Tax=Pseudoxanthomonas broegbernensis TaxID=83619 RepID=A0A7V8GK19_9GAMM|nr:5'-nucleotidase, lipoprotein e(P4) family [Pseudoxanthomonas broegbernensis]KAF1684684.1 5'-nucleotidase, lipoprotein e(P4) family [Pseudoxanthomonas broegbernensis]MBB6066442.1 acid phosphatase [Pseudoxanthomonas broegbernensis]
MRLPLTCALLALALAACQPVRPAAPAAAAVAVAADDNLNAVLWLQRSAEYRALAEQTYRAAADHLDAALAEADWDALVPEERGPAVAARPPAVVLDIDETVLDNSPYQARLVRDGGEYDDPSWDAWVEERKATAVPGAVEFARAAGARGIVLVYISNRATHLKRATLDNLRAQGLPVADESVFLGLGTAVDGCEQHGSEKDCRRRLVGQRYRVLMQFGDQLGDFVHIDANTPEGRQRLLDRYRDWFGRRWWMLPNPTYGSWEPALFDNAWSQPRQTRRAAKRAALEVAP